MRSCMAVAYYRGVTAARLIKGPQRGKMLAAGANAATVTPLLNCVRNGFASIACYNSPRSVTVSGDQSAVLELQGMLNELGIFNRLLVVDAAYHSDHMLSVAKQYLESLKAVGLTGKGAEKIAFLSSLTATELDTDILRTPEYWALNLTSPVQFSKAMSLALDLAASKTSSSAPPVIVEIGPHGALKGPIREIILSRQQSSSSENATPSPRYLSAIQRNGDAYEDILDLAASLVNCSQPVNPSAIASETTDSASRRVLLDLPIYRFTKQRQYWQTNRLHQDIDYNGTPWNVILGHRISNANGNTAQFRNVFTLEDIPWLRDHRVSGQTIFPMAGYIAAVLEAVASTVPNWNPSEVGFCLQEVVVSKAFVLSEPGQNEMFTTLTPHRHDTRTLAAAFEAFNFEVQSWTEQTGFREHCRGIVMLTHPDVGNFVSASFIPLQTLSKTQALKAELQASCTQPILPSELYKAAAQNGLEYGPAFRGLTALHTGKQQAMGMVEPFDTAATMPQQFEGPELILHPTLFDAMLHIGLCNMSGNPGDPAGIRCHVPTFVREMRIGANAGEDLKGALEVYAHNIEYSRALRTTSVDMTTVPVESSEPVITIQGLKTFKLNDDIASSQVDEENEPNALTVSWKKHPAFLSSSDLEDLLERDVEAEARVRWRREQACYYWMERALLSAPEIPQASYLKRLRHWMEATVQKIATSAPTSRQGQWRALSDEARDQFLQNFENDPSESDFYGHLGNNLGSILREEQSSLNVLMEEDRLFRVYQENSGFTKASNIAGEILHLLSLQNPSLKICEVGAGTGGSAIRVLEKIGTRCQLYDYTDVSTGFFDAAREKFATFSQVMNFRRLDITDDVEAQGFEAGSYDVVIAADVIHATPDVLRSLQHVRKLLKPGGVFVLVELSSEVLAMLPFATLPGWWHRREGPMLSQKVWNDLLHQAGFPGIDAQTKDNPEVDVHSVMVSHRAQPPLTDFPARSVQILASDCSEKDVFTLAGQLELRLLRREGIRSVESSTIEEAKGQHDVCICLDELSAPLLASPTPAQLQALQRLFIDSRAILWVTRRPGQDTPKSALSDFAFGFARTVRREIGSLKFVVLQVDDDDCGPDTLSERIDQVVKHCFVERRGPSDSELDWRISSGSVLFPRAIPLEPMREYMRLKNGQMVLEQQPFWQKGRLVQLHMEEAGSLSALHFKSDPHSAEPLGDNDVLLEIKASGVNFRDLLIALGHVPGRSFGRECCGIVVKAGCSAAQRLQPGQRVLHLGEGLFASHIRCRADSVVKVPDSMTDEQVASIGVVYATAYECFVNVAKLKRGETVLIHAAAGGVGQAAIIVAKWLGAEIFCTVGTLEKKELIMSQFGIPEDHIFWSRSAAFADSIQLATKGRGIDVLLNSLSGDLLRASWACMAPLGRFVEIGKRDIQANSQLAMMQFDKAISYSAVDLDLLIRLKPEAVQSVLEDIIGLFRSGDFLPPTPIHAVPISELQRGFRNLQSGKLPGKTVVFNAESAMVDVRLNPASPVPIRPDCSYMITGGTGGLGRSLTRWLISRGATSIVLVSRSGGDKLPGSDLEKLHQEARTCNARLYVDQCDVANAASFHHLLSKIQKSGMPDVGGVIHGAMELKDSLFETTSYQDWMAGIKPKINGAFNLHQAFATMRLELDFFLCLSSSVAITGNPGQTSYAGSNSVLDAFAQWRRGQGLPTASINLPGIRGAGYVAEMLAKTGDMNFERLLAYGISHAQFLGYIEAVLTPDSLNNTTGSYSSIVAGFPALASRAELYGELGPLLSVLAEESAGAFCGASPAADGIKAARHTGLKQRLQVADSAGAKHEAVLDALTDKLSSILMIPRDEITPARSIEDLGLDSLVSVELRNFIVRETDAAISVLDVANSTSVLDLSNKILDRMGVSA